MNGICNLTGGRCKVTDSDRWNTKVWQRQDRQICESLTKWKSEKGKIAPFASFLPFFHSPFPFPFTLLSSGFWQINLLIYPLGGILSWDRLLQTGSVESVSLRWKSLCNQQMDFWFDLNSACGGNKGWDNEQEALQSSLPDVSLHLESWQHAGKPGKC